MQQRRFPPHRSANVGFTLIELIVTSLLVSVVILVSWSGLISLTHMSSVAEARSLRQLEVNKALDFVSEELRMAKYVNANATRVVDGNTTNLVDLLTDEGFDLTRLGDYGDLSLYLEIPAASTPPTTCPAGGPNAGAPPPSPSDYDQVIYDVRDSPNEWLGPRTLMRYGRIRSLNGNFDPCSTAISSDPVADALSNDPNSSPTCPGVLTGGEGFYACKENEQTQVMFQNTLVDSSVQQISSVATSRIQPIQSEDAGEVGCHNESELAAPEHSDTKAEITFVNKRAEDVDIWVLDKDGNRDRKRDNLKFNNDWETSDKKTGTPWIVTDQSGQCLSIFTTKVDDSIAVIKE